MLARNEVADDDLVSIFVTATPDLTAAYPASAVRALGYADVPLLGAQEQSVRGGLPRCIRILIHCYSARRRAESACSAAGRAAGQRNSPAFERQVGCQ